jgi:hypothetical protein
LRQKYYFTPKGSSIKEFMVREISSAITDDWGWKGFWARN